MHVSPWFKFKWKWSDFVFVSVQKTRDLRKKQMKMDNLHPTNSYADFMAKIGAAQDEKRNNFVPSFPKWYW
jgi:hypothetical protein